MKHSLDTGKFPIVEIFGPTIQGEGPLVGTQVAFIRFGGCDYRCSWCDSMHAVLPEEVRKHAKKMTTSEILIELDKLAYIPQWIVLSGGNPALQDLDSVVDSLIDSKHLIAIETQGTFYKSWLRKCHSVAISPKPPSSTMVTDWKKLDSFVRHLTSDRNLDSNHAHKNIYDVFFKVVIFNDEDLDFAEHISLRYTSFPLYLSLGTHVNLSSRDELLDRLRDFLLPQVFERPALHRSVISCQQHVLIWGHAKGV